VVETTGNRGGASSGLWDLGFDAHEIDRGSRRPGFKVVASTFGWVVGQWGACNASCGFGTHSRTVQCVLEDGSVAPDSTCVESKPPSVEVCEGTSGCTYSWIAASYAACPTSCGNSYQTRPISCERSDGTTAGDDNCKTTKPVNIQACSDFSACTFAWDASVYGPCSAVCGGGTQARTVQCLRSDGAPVADASCAGAGDKPASKVACNTQSCFVNATSCKTLRDAGTADSGTYTIDPDGAGPLGAIQVYCDMTSMGGGWTNADFVARRIHLGGGAFIQCQSGLTLSSGGGLRCDSPVFNDDRDASLYQYGCTGNDRSADWLIDEVGPLVGHKDQDLIGGWTKLDSRFDGSNAASAAGAEYCFVGGQVVLHSDSRCAKYNAFGNGACVPSYFVLSR
jgi:hypothetical protein